MLDEHSEYRAATAGRIVMANFPIPRLEHNGLKWVESWAEERIEYLHRCLEAPLGIEETNLVRGQMQNVRRCLEDARRDYDEVPGAGS